MSNANYDHKTGFVAYPDDRAGPTGRKAPFVDHGTKMPDKDRYLSQEEADLEWQQMWRKVWMFAGLEQDLQEVGDYFRADLGRESFVVVRTEPDRVQAFFNVCPHRGNRLVYNEFGRAHPCFQCCFHGWEFELNGKLKQIKDEYLFRPEVIADRPGLTEVRCEIWNSLVFINMDPDAKPLLEHLDVIPEHLKDYPFSEFRVFRDIECVWDANWKTALDGFLEFYHADDVHPELVSVTETLQTQYDLYANGNSRMIIPIGYAPPRLSDRETVSEDLQGMIALYGGDPSRYTELKGWEYDKALCDTKRRWGERNGYDFFDKLTDDQITDDWNYFVFPSITLNVFSDGLMIQRFMPHGSDPNKMVYTAITMCLPLKDPEAHVFDINSFGPEAFGPKGWDGSERPRRIQAQTPEDYGHALAQDAAVVPNAHAGFQSEAFAGPRLSDSECRIRHYLAEIDAYLGRAQNA